MSSSNMQGMITGVSCAFLGALGYYLINPNLVKSVFVGAIGLTVSILEYAIIKYTGRRESDQNSTER